MNRMRRIAGTSSLAALAVCAAALLTACAGGGNPPGSEMTAGQVPEQPDMASFLRIRTPGSAELGPGGAMYFRDWPDGVNQLYVRGPGASMRGPMTRLTDFEDGLSSYSVSPDRRTVILSAAQGGNEQHDLWLLDTATNGVTPALQNPDVQYSADAWLRDSTGFFYTANDDSPSDFHVYLYDLGSGRSEKVLEREGTWYVADVTDDGSRALVGTFRSISDSRIFEMDVSSGDLRDLSATPEGAPSSNSAVGYLPGETSILMISDFDGGLERLYVRNLSGDASEPPREALPALSRWELDSARINDACTHVAVTHNEDGFSTLRVFTLPELNEVSLPPIERGTVGIADFENSTLLFTLSNAQTPGITYAIDISNASRGRPTAEAVTTRMDGEPIDLSEFRLPRLIKYRSFDGLEIPAFVYLPADFQDGQPVPFIVIYHGGPEGQSRPGFSAVNQYFLSRGFGVMLPNVRGSTGYGRAFHERDNYLKRWDSVKDGVEAARWLVRQGYSAPGKIAAYGGSYGGYMSVATIVEDNRSPDPVFGASVDIVGIVNMKTFLEQTKDYRRELREAEYGPLADPSFLLSVSPIQYIDLIRAPMLIAHGLNDPRVPVGEALQLHVGLLKLGREPDLLIFPDEGHGFAKLENRLVFYERAAEFLEKHIGD